jgi:Serine dehydrogenase proteinase
MGVPPQPQLPPPQPQAFNIDFGQLFGANRPAGSKKLLESLGKVREGNALSLVYVDFLPANPMISGDVIPQLESLLLEMGKVQKLNLFLRSTGGMAEIPWKIVSLLRSFCSKFEVVIPRNAMSGATHVAIGADELVMSPLSFLGSVDPTRTHPLLPRDPQNVSIPVSVQDLKHCLEFVKRNVPEGEKVGPILNQLFAQVSPLAIGALEQSYELSRLITQKVLATRKKTLGAKSVQNVVDRLAGKYFSHGYFISRDEVENDLRLPVTRMEPGDETFKASEALNGYYMSVFEKEVPITGAPIPLTFRITGFLETATSRRILCQVIGAGPKGPNTLVVAGAWLSDPNS